MSPCDLRPSAVGRALHALEPDEEQELLKHLPHCASCRRTLREATDVAAALGAAVPVVEPPPGLRERILDAARADARDRPAPRPAPAAEAGPVVPIAGARPARPPWSRRSVALVAVAAAVLGVGLLSARAVLPTESPTPQTVAATDRAQRIVESAESRDPASRQATLRGADGSTVGVVLADATGPRLLPLTLPDTGPDRDYVLWSTGGENPVAVGTLDPAEGVTRPVPGAPVPAGRGYAVSVETSGAVPARPSNVVASGTLV